MQVEAEARFCDYVEKLPFYNHHTHGEMFQRRILRKAAPNLAQQLPHVSQGKGQAVALHWFVGMSELVLGHSKLLLVMIAAAVGSLGLSTEGSAKDSGQTACSTAETSLFTSSEPIV